MSAPFSRFNAVMAMMAAALAAGRSTYGITYVSRGKSHSGGQPPFKMRRSGKQYPERSKRQDMRDSKYENVIVNGFEIMQHRQQ